MICVKNSELKCQLDKVCIMILNETNFIHQPNNLQDLVRYRVEQEVSIKLNRTPVNNTTVKTDYTVKRDFQNPLFYSVRVDEHISKITPDAHQAVLDVVKQVDVIKNNVDVLINGHTGKPEIITNHQSIISEWEDFREEYLKKHDFLRAEATRQNVMDFLSVFDGQINSHDQLISGLNSQVFFNTFFDYFLAPHPQGFESDLTMHYHSLLFQSIVTPLSVNQKIIRETPETVTIRKTGVPEDNINAAKIKEQYDEKYRPIIDYQFSEYLAEYDATIEFNTDKKYIEYADIRMNESIRNNVEMDIHCRIWRIQ